MPSLLHRVKTRLAIHAHRKLRAMLEGEYTSVFQGRSVEFDDLRPYVAGDEPRDIDWKATARHGAPLIRRYIATRGHIVLVVADTGRGMAALSADGETKSEIGVLVAGIIGYLALRHGDRVALAAGDAEGSHFVRAGGTEAHLERLLQRIAGDTTLHGAHSSLLRQLDFVARAIPRRMILLVISDDRAIDDNEARLLRRLALQHEILWVTIADADLMRSEWSARAMHDVGTGGGLPAFLRSDSALRADFERAVAERERGTAELLTSLSISSQRIASSDDAVPALFRLLRMHRHARR